MPLGDGEVTANDVNEWVQEQAQFLESSQSLLLWYLAANAFRSETNPEGRSVGDVLSGRCRLPTICLRTGLSDKTVRRTLIELQERGYIIAQLPRGRGKNKISVFWSEVFDEMRAEVRAGARELPKHFARPVRGAKQIPEIEHTAVVINFPKRSR